MSEIICPVCNYPTVPIGIEEIGEDKIICPACHRHGSKKLWDSFISTKKKLDLAIKAMKISNEIVYSAYGSPLKTLKDALEQIKDNDKDVK